MVMPPRTVITHSPDETMDLGRQLARELAPPKIVMLSGDLGAGKTTLIKGIAEGFGAAEAENVTSPTFTLIHEYRGPGATLFHIDLYRIDTQRELDTLALADLQSDDAVILVEWGEKFEQVQKDSNVKIRIDRVNDSERMVTLELPA
jgi:tRNA threonylcarbamoyladenosine biosynthesis protein TsaE